MMITSESPEGPAVAVRAVLRAPRDKVFRAWTEPALVSRWFFAEEGYETRDVEIELRALGAYRIVVRPLDGGPETRIHGHYIDVDDGRALSYTWTGACSEEQYWTLVSVAFDDDPETGGTIVRLTHGVFRNDVDRAMHEQGWFACLTCLDRFLAA